VKTRKASGNGVSGTTVTTAGVLSFASARFSGTKCYHWCATIAVLVVLKPWM